nr:30S ribosome-binding factor RbfA [Micromonospora sp. DSM 115978]
MTDSAKVRRHAERVRELVASVVRTQIKDPRLGMITITDARLTADLRDATVFYTVLGDAAAQAGTAAALDSARGMLRSTVGKALGLRHSPSLTFVLDDVQDQVKHIDELLVAARNADAEVQRLAAGAAYAGDAQPYRVDDDADDEGDADSDVDADRDPSGGGRAAAGGRAGDDPAAGGSRR